MNRALRFAIFLVGMAGAALPRASAESPLVPVEGPATSAELISIIDGRAVFRTAREETPMGLADLVSWGSPTEAIAGPQLVFANGDLVVAKVLSADQDMLRAESYLFGEVSIPIESLSGIVFQPPGDRYARDRLVHRLLTATGDADRLLLENGDEIDGTLVTLESKSGEEPVEALLETATGEISVGSDRMAAVVFNPSLIAKAESSGLVALVGFRDGTRLTASAVTADDVRLALGLSGDQSWTGPRDLMVWIQPLGGRAVYLSDLKPESYKHVPFLSLEWPYRLDRNVRGDRLRAAGRLFAKGIGMHSASRLTWPLDRPYRRFEAELAIDAAAGPRGSVGYRVFVDGDERYKSPTVRGGDPPLAISVDVSGGKRLSLVVDYAERGEELDYADWLDARVVE